MGWYFAFAPLAPPCYISLSSCFAIQRPVFEFQQFDIFVSRQQTVMRGLNKGVSDKKK